MSERAHICEVCEKPFKTQPIILENPDVPEVWHRQGETLTFCSPKCQSKWTMNKLTAWHCPECKHQTVLVDEFEDSTYRYSAIDMSYEERTDESGDDSYPYQAKCEKCGYVLTPSECKKIDITLYEFPEFTEIKVEEKDEEGNYS